ncbi:DNA translocase FtsK [Thalassobius vesicularis]|uniref:DNA translocase FtsK n=1 Tax=Thalassobius vesicularis TaxID=1294297 RepID=A0A4S3MDP2_9RHOB|nr:DNA translocase FtsK [Thalassobius vesicularis]THD76597.1 DNA translocase FtsK [Thalassobius vesicularis]
MAFQTRGRDPLFDSDMQAAIEKRGKELIGIALVVLGAAAVAMMASYSANDPSFMLATDAPVQNLLGRIGASIAAPLFMILGLGSWGLAIALLAWGFRFGLHQGEERALSRALMTPIWMAVISVYASTLAPGPDWGQGFGLGGHFGDTVLGVLLGVLPVSMAFGIKMMSVVFAVMMVGLGAFVLGFSVTELRRIFRFLVLGVVMMYALLLAVLGRGATGAFSAAQSMQARQRDRRASRAAATPDEPQEEWVEPFDEVMETWEQPEPQPAPKPGLLGRVPGLIRRPEPMPEPELVEPELAADPQFAPGDDRIKAKIADVIRSRAVHPAPVAPQSPVIAAVKDRPRGPSALVLDTSRRPTLPPEPPMTGPRHTLPTEPTMTRKAAEPTPEPRPWSQPEMQVQPEYVEQNFEASFEDFDTYTDELPDENIFDMADDVPLESYDQPTPAARPSIPVQAPRKVVVQPLNRKPIQPSTRAQSEAQPSLAFEEPGHAYELPPLNLLANPANIQRHHLSDEALEENARMLENVLDDYGVKGDIVSVRPGPVVTMYELEPAPGLKASRVIGLADDIARSMSALSARVSTVPGRSVIGIELPNEHREKVVLREILAARSYGDANMKLPLALGKDIGGEPMVANLAKMPHLLIAGTTGSGKSVAINTMILSLLYRLTPEECRLIMIDPKMLELSVYDGIPHLLSPVVTDPKKAVVALKWTVGEMEDRYRKMSKMGVRNIDGYNSRVEDALSRGETFSRTVQTGFDDETGDPIFETEEITPVKMPYIVVIVDEMADLMMVAGKEIEACIQRLAQMARASGIHIIMATQRPSVDVITGTIKANFPTRISFQVTSKVDSRTILGEMGAEQLLGMGDMLYMAGGAKITRCHGPFVSDEEVEEIVRHLKSFGPPDYVGGVVEGPDDDKADNIDAVLGLNTGGNTDMEDALYDTAVAIVIKDRKCSTSYIQRKLAIGYNKAARLVEQMEEQGIVSSANHVGKREILVPEQ